MFLKFLICSTLMCFAVADVKDLSRMYLPVPQQEVIVKPDVGSVIAQDVPDLPQNDISENDLKLENPETLTKETFKDPAYGNIPFGYNGFPGGFTGVFPSQGFPGQGFPGQGFPVQGFPGQGFPGQFYPRPPLSPQGFLGQGPGFPPQGFPGPIVPPGPGFPGQVFPGQGFINPGFPGQGYPNYPAYFSTPEQLKTEGRYENEGNKLRLRDSNIDTQYDATNGGYLYKKPSVTF